MFRILEVSVPVPKLYQRNILFNPTQNEVFVRDNAFDHHYQLDKQLKKHGHKIATDDIISLNDADIVVFHNMPRTIPKRKEGQLFYLILSEPSVVMPENYDPKNHRWFDRVFTWNDDLVDDDKYIKLRTSQKFPTSIPKSARKKFCTMIAGNKSSPFPNELYSRRVELIRWFEKKHPEEFDLYGVGWNDYYFRGPLLIRAFNRVKFVRKCMFKLMKAEYPSYRGSIENKFDVLKNYTFTITYENEEKTPGYITEKIFDAFLPVQFQCIWGHQISQIIYPKLVS